MTVIKKIPRQKNRCLSFSALAKHNNYRQGAQSFCIQGFYGMVRPKQKSGAHNRTNGNTDEMVTVLKKIMESGDLRNDTITKGYDQALKFREEKLVSGMMSIYSGLL